MCSWTDEMRVLALNIEEQAAQWVVAENMKRSKLTTADKKVFTMHGSHASPIPTTYL